MSLVSTLSAAGRPLVLASAMAVTGGGAVATEEVRREELRVTTSDGVGIRVREVRAGSGRAGPGLILVHGARVPGIGSFDLPVPGGSLAADLSQRTGRPVYVVDARGYGGSDRAPAFTEAASGSRPLSRAHEVVRDLDAVVAEVRRRTGTERVALLGWATGGMWAGYYASLWPERVSHLVSLNALYGGSDRHPTLGPGSPNADPAEPRRIRPNLGGYSLTPASALLPGWDSSIPGDDKAAWRGEAIRDAYVKEALASDPSSGGRTPPSFRTPLGAIEDSFYQAGGRRLFDAGSIAAHTLIVRSERDFWSRPDDAQAMARDAGRARSVEILALPDATHFVHLERPERGRARLIEAVAELLGRE